MKFKNPLHKFFNRRDQVAVLNEVFAATKQISDPGQRLLLLREISNDAYLIIDDVNTKSLGTTLPAAIAGIGCMIGGAATANPVLVGAGVAMAFGGAGARMSMGEEAFEELWRLRERCREDEKEILATVSIHEISKSAKFEMVMKTYPALREKFNLPSGSKNTSSEKSAETSTSLKPNQSSRKRFKP